MSPDDAKATLPLAVSAPTDERATLPLPGELTDTTPLADPAGRSLPPHIGRFVVRGWLGAGAFGDVYRAFDPQLDREVAVKVAKPGSLDTPERLARFLREAKAAANLRHPHIIPLYETGTDGDRRFIVSAFVDGRTLEAVTLENPGSHAGGGQRDGLPLHTVADIGRKLADALAYAHSQGVIHRDVKPANVLVDAAGEPHLLDFGLAAREEEGAERLTQDGQGMGTPAYMAPEQADGNGTAASDQYSLGCTLYELATGRTPFAGGPAQQVFLHRTETPPSPRSVRPDVPKDLDTLILKCLEKEPPRRYPTCSDLADDLRRFAAGEPVMVRRAGPVERVTRWAKRNRKLAGMGLLVVLTILLGSGASLGFGLYANEQAGVAKKEKKNADDKTQDAERETRRANDSANDAKREAERANAEAKESRRRLDLSRLRDAATAFNANQIALARDTLAEITEENRCLGWGMLRRRAEGSLFAMWHAEGVSDVATSADGSRVVSGSEDGVARVWDGRTGELVTELRGHTRMVTSVAVSADGSRAATASTDMTARVWDCKSGKEVSRFKGHTGFVWGVALSADGTRAVTTSTDLTARVWDADTSRELLPPLPLPVPKPFTPGRPSMSADASRIVTVGGKVQVWDGATGRPLLELKDEEPALGPVAISADGTRVAAGYLHHSIGVWETDSGKLLATLRGAETGVDAVHLTADGSRVVGGGKDGVLRVWDTKGPQPLLELKGHTDWIGGVAVTADGSRVVTAGGRDKSVRVWDAQIGRTWQELRRAAYGVNAAAITPDGARVFTGGRDGGVRVWDATTGGGLANWTGHTDWVQAVAVSADGTRVVSGSADKTARVWDANTGKCLHTLRGHTSLVRLVGFSGDGRRVISGSADKTARVWDAASGRELAVLRGDFGWMAPPALSPDGTRVLAGVDDKTVRVYDADTGRTLTELRGMGGSLAVSGTAYSPDGRTLLVGWKDEARTYDADTGRLIQVFRGNQFLTGVAFSADGHRVLVCDGPKLRVFDTATGWPLFDLPAPGLRVGGISVSADGRRVVAHSTDMSGKAMLPGGAIDNAMVSDLAVVWDTQSADVERHFRGHTGVVNCWSLAPDRGRVVTGSRDSTARVWDAESGDCLLTLTGHTKDVTAVAVSPDGLTLATGSEDTTARVWNTANGTAGVELRGHPGRVERVAFSADGSVVLTWSNGKPFAWDATTGAAVTANPPAPATATSAAPHRYVATGNWLVRMPERIDKAERARRLWLTRPAPEWHVLRHRELKADGNTTGAALQLVAEGRARIALAGDAGEPASGTPYIFQAGAAKKPPSAVPVTAPPQK